MAAVAKSVEQTTELLQKLKVDVKSKVGDKNENGRKGDSGESMTNGGVHENGGEHGMYYTVNGYAVPHGYVYEYPHGGYGVNGEWEEYPRYVGMDGVEVHAQGMYGEGASVVFHPGYGYASQPYGAYNHGPMPAYGADGQLYGPPAFQYPGHVYQQAMPPGAQYMPSGAMLLGGAEPSGDHAGPSPDGTTTSGTNASLVTMGPRPGYQMMASHAPYRGVIPVPVHGSGGQDVQVYDGLRAAAPSWTDTKKAGDAQQRVASPGLTQTNTSQSLVSPGNLSQPSRPTGQHMRPTAPVQLHVPMPQVRPSQPPAPSPVLGPGSLARGFPPLARGVPSQNVGQINRGLNGLGTDMRGNGRAWIGVDKNKIQPKAPANMPNGNGNLDILNEQNRGPRTARFKTQRTTPGLSRQPKNQTTNVDTNGVLDRDQFNRADFVTTYEDAKFFIIKSYSEDDVHKSIKYGVWASTPNGNKRLDAAYQDSLKRAASNKQGSCPIFLLFSVNASGQFCGLAEMTGPVDFLKSLDFWQQDKWNGRFTVKWHVIKDVPNSQFRHIILENNDNKPVTNSRDTQEVKLEKGIEMLNIFKNFPAKGSILDDFQFYEQRQRAMQEKRSKNQVNQVSQHPLQASVAPANGHLKPEDVQGKFKVEQTFKMAVDGGNIKGDGPFEQNLNYGGDSQGERKSLIKPTLVGVKKEPTANGIGTKNAVLKVKNSSLEKQSDAGSEAVAPKM